MIGIIGAMKEEVALLKEFMQIEKTICIGSREYYQGTLFNKKIILVLSNIGKVAASITTTLMINNFDIDYILFMGVAGAGNLKVKVGDIVIADYLLQHDVDVRPFYTQHEVAVLKKALFEVDKKLAEALLKATHDFVEHSLTRYVHTETLKKFNITKPSVHVATIASGDQFIHDATLRLDIEKRIQELQDVSLGGIEMEGGAVAQVCYELNKPCIVLRTISDDANQSAAVDFNAFLKELASQYALGIIEAFLK